MSEMTNSPSKNDLNNSPKWKRPDEVMAIYRLKVKKKALQARISQSGKTEKPQECFLNQNVEKVDNNIKGLKRRNPFSKGLDTKRLKENESITPDLDLSSDNTLFKLLHMSSSNVIEEKHIDSENPLKNFMNKLNQLTQKKEECIEYDKPKKYNFIPIDWTLKTKMRIICQKPFKWSSKLKTSEEASGITGFVRCLDTMTSQTLDTSMNARCYQCCLIWQHPSLPWLNLFPRSRHGRISQTSPNLIANSPETVQTLHTDWTESFRSLFQLVRTRQCPYFYVCANSFTVLFRAAGICGFNETTALVTPTTRGLRQTLKQEDVEFTMPLKKSTQNNRLSTDGSLDLECDNSDAHNEISMSSQNNLLNNTSQFKKIYSSDSFSGEEIKNQLETNDEDDDDDEGGQEQWLESLGVEKSEIKKIHNSQARKTQTTECSIDNSEQSLILVEGIEAQALFNFLINCKSIIATTGYLAGIPPTLLAPVAFHGAALRSLKMRESKVCVDNSDYYSMELRGPILPHTIHTLGALLHCSDTEYSATFANVTNTTAFSKINSSIKNSTSNDNSSAVFGQENLKDCGLSLSQVKHFCSPNPEYIQVIDSLKFTGNDLSYTWS